MSRTPICPRYRVVSEDGINTTVIDLGTGEDLSHSIAGVRLRIRPDRVIVAFIMRDASVAFDVAARSSPPVESPCPTSSSC